MYINITLSMYNNNNIKCERIRQPNQNSEVLRWIKTLSIICCLQETHFRFKDTVSLKIKG